MRYWTDPEMGLTAISVRRLSAFARFHGRRLALQYTCIRYYEDEAYTNAVVGFIGLGNMGLPMARNLAKKNKILAFDTNPDARHAASISIMEVSDTISHLKDCSMIFTMLPGCQVVDQVMSDLHNVVDHQNTIIVDCSTVSPTTSRRWHDAWKVNGCAMLDAPVSGGTKGAMEGTLTFMVGYDDKMRFEQAKPFLYCMGDRIIPCGGPGTGAATKLCNNVALAAQMVGICEAMNLGESLGVDPVLLAEVMNTSTASCWSSKVNNPHPSVARASGSPASQDYVGGFSARLMLKDLGLAAQAAEDNGVALPLVATSRELYKLAGLRGMADRDFGIMLQLLRGK